MSTPRAQDHPGTATAGGPPAVAVAIPCHNEAATIGQVLRDFRRVLPEAALYVFDNRSCDGTAKVAEEAGATVVTVRAMGKGHAMRAIFDTVDADALIVTDGDGTYVAEDAPRLLAPIFSGEADMVVGNRLDGAPPASLSRLHFAGNRLIVGVINLVFRTSYRDVLSGYRALSRKFIDSVPVLTSGFEIETELTLQAMNLGLAVVEVPIGHRPRPPGSTSKLHAFRDGYRILLTAAILLRDLHPLRVYGAAGALCVLAAAAAGVLWTVAASGTEILPRSTLAGLVLLFAPLGVLLLGTGLVLNAINTRFRELRQLTMRAGRRRRRDD